MNQQNLYEYTDPWSIFGDDVETENVQDTIVADKFFMSSQEYFLDDDVPF